MCSRTRKTSSARPREHSARGRVAAGATSAQAGAAPGVLFAYIALTTMADDSVAPSFAQVMMRYQSLNPERRREMALAAGLTEDQFEQRAPSVFREAKRLLWKTVSAGNVDNLREYLQGLPPGTLTETGTNSRTGWTIVHEAVERGHSGAMLTMTVRIMGADSVNKKTRTGLTPAHVAASKRDTLALMALANLGADLSVLSADRVQLRELQKQASEEPPEPLEQARLMLATLDPSALTQPNLDTMQIDLATTK